MQATCVLCSSPIPFPLPAVPPASPCLIGNHWYAESAQGVVVRRFSICDVHLPEYQAKLQKSSEEVVKGKFDIKNVEWQAIKGSRAIKQLGYCPSSQAIVVVTHKLSGYVSFNLGRDVFEEFVKADSLGTFWKTSIQKKPDGSPRGSKKLTSEELAHVPSL